MNLDLKWLRNTVSVRPRASSKETSRQSREKTQGELLLLRGSVSSTCVRADTIGSFDRTPTSI